MMHFIDEKLNKITMYRLVLYYLFGLLVCAVEFGFGGLLPYSPLAIVISTVIITLACYLANLLFAYVFEVPANVESLYITALILVFLITPIKSFYDADFYSLTIWASVLAMASKYILAIRKKHIFNPAAIAVFITSYTLGLSASWWVGTAWMLVPVLAGGLLLTRKLLRFDLVLSFFFASFATVVVTNLSSPSLITVLERFFFASPVLFFAFVMLTEPLTTPPRRVLRIIYGAMVGVLFAPASHIGGFYFTPEIALLIGNIFAYFVSPKEKLVLKLTGLKEIAKDTYDFIFAPGQKFSFTPGQYMEWTYAHANPDSRGNRRYFTIASSPTENEVRMGVKFYPNMSTYKHNLLKIGAGEMVVAAQRSGDFVMPKNKNKKLVFIAGGIGITPFRSMIKYLVDTKEQRDIVLMYSNKNIEDIAYADVFDDAYNKLGIRTVYTITDSAPAEWSGERGFIDAAMIQKYAPDFSERIFYISGPHSMVKTFENLLRSMGVKGSAIKIDFFPGFA